MLAKEQLPVNTFFRRAEKFYESKMIMSRYNTNENVPISRIYCIGGLAYQKGNIINERRKAREYRARKKLQATT